VVVVVVVVGWSALHVLGWVQGWCWGQLLWCASSRARGAGVLCSRRY
jgi:hypothetical protein